MFPDSLESLDPWDFFPDRSARAQRIYAIEPGNRHLIVVSGAVMNFSRTSLIRYCGGLPVPPLDSRVEELARCSFSHVPMTTFTFSEHSRLRFIGPCAFIYCKRLRSITIPSTVEVIGTRAFQFCQALRAVRIEMGSQLRLIERGAFDSCETLEPIEVPSPAKIQGAFRVLGTGRDEWGFERMRVQFPARKS
jgi:hypothetical protein